MKTLKGTQEDYRLDQRKYEVTFFNGDKLSSPTYLYYIHNFSTQIKSLKLAK